MQDDKFTDLLAALNAAYAADPAAIHALIVNQVPCNQALADHPSVVVKANKVAQGETYAVTALGLLNAAVQTLTGKRVAVMYDDTPNERGAHRILGFAEYIAF